MPFGRFQQTCPICERQGCYRKHTAKVVRKERPLAVTHIAGYVPPKGSVAQMFFGTVIRPVKGLHA
jgi:hypothetical protein